MSETKSYRIEVQAPGPDWCGNALRFATAAEALANALDLASRWMLVRATRVQPSDDPVNYTFKDGVLASVVPW